jgi:hypothetical protein
MELWTHSRNPQSGKIMDFVAQSNNYLYQSPANLAKLIR